MNILQTSGLAAMEFGHVVEASFTEMNEKALAAPPAMSVGASDATTESPK
jgi:hypothetical protein